MRTIRNGLAVAGSEAWLALNQLVAISVITLPVAGVIVGLLQLHDAPATVQTTTFVLFGAAQILWLALWARQVHRLANSLADHRLTLLSEQFRMWQRDRGMRLIVLSYKAPHEGLNFVRRYAIARRLHTYQCEVNHQQLWQRALRLLPRRFVMYVVVYGSATKPFAIGRLGFAARTRDFSLDAWMKHLVNQVNAIYA